MAPALRPARFALRPALLAGLTAALTLSACYREASDITLSSIHPRYTGNAPWAVDGVRPGQTLAEIKLIRGEPAKPLVSTSPHSTAFQWPDPRATAVTFDAAGRAIDIYGTTLTAEGRTLASPSLESAAVEHVLGSGRVSEHSSPSGSGVISLGRKVTGRTVTYENHGSLIEVLCNTDHVTAVRARPKK